MTNLNKPRKEKMSTLLSEKWRLPEAFSLSGKDSEHQELFFTFWSGLRDLARDVESGKPGMPPEQRAEARAAIQRLYENYLEDRETEVFALVREEKIPTKAQHYNRNRSMPLEILPKSPEEAEQWGWNDGVAADCHQFTSPDKTNRKYVSPDGKLEAIFDKNGNLVTASEDCGTYNFSDPTEDPIGHFYMDVLPWIVWGNDEKDSTDIRMRLHAFVIDGGVNLLKEKAALKAAGEPKTPEDNVAAPDTAQ